MFQLSSTLSFRYYRNSLELLKHAAAAFQRDEVSFGVNLGDIVDGKNRTAAEEQGLDPEAAGEKAVGMALEAFGILKKPFHHIIGNHCLYTMPRQRLNELCVSIEALLTSEVFFKIK